MSVVDKRGKVLGFINAVDLVIVLIILATIIGFFLARSGHTPINNIIKAEGPAEVTIAIRGARIQNLDVFKKYKKAFIIIRNQPYTDVEIVKMDVWRRPLHFYDQNQKKLVSVVNEDDPLATDIDLVIRDNAQFTGKDIVLGGNKVKAGITVQLETMEYSFHGTIIDVKMPGVVD